MTTESHDIVALDDPIGSNTLRQLIMEMRAPFSNAPLFCSVDSRMTLQDQTTIPGVTVFSYSADLKNVAEDAVKKLGLIIVNHVGNAAWQWFTESASVSLPKTYQLNDAQDKYESISDIQLRNIDALGNETAPKFQHEDDASLMDDDSDDDDALNAKTPEPWEEPPPSKPFCVVLNMDFITE